jgi:preprotein translocase subunit YajC
MFNQAYAQTSTETQTPASAAGAPQQPNAFVQFFPFILIFFVFYFLVIRPQKKKMQNEQKLLSELKKGDEIVTKSGVLGSIVGLTDKLVTLEVSQGVKIKILRTQIAGAAKNYLYDNTPKKQ